MSGELLRTTTLSSHSSEDGVDSVSFRLSIYIPEMFEEGVPSCWSVLLEKLVDGCVLASGEFGFEEAELILRFRHFRSGEGVFDPFDPRLDVTFVEVGEVRLLDRSDV